MADDKVADLLAYAAELLAHAEVLDNDGNARAARALRAKAAKMQHATLVAQNEHKFGGPR